ILLCVALAACTPAAVTPGARTMPMASPTAPGAHGDVQGSIGGAGTVFGPGVDTGGARYRQKLDANTVLEVDGGMLRVNNDNGASGVPDRIAYTGRVGLMWPN